MIFYVLLTHGKKPQKGTLSRHPAARQQIANLKAFKKRMEATDAADGSEVQLYFDYCREVLELRSLPILRAILEAAREQNARIFLDDIGRLFRAARPEKRITLAEDIEPFTEHLFGLKQKGSLAMLSDWERVKLVAGLHSGRFVLARPPAKARSANARKDQTEEATHASIAARRSRADGLAKKLARIQFDLPVDGNAPTQKQIAEEANRQYLHTSRGGSWTSTSVGRALKRLERPTLTERARKLRDAKKVAPDEPEAG